MFFPILFLLSSLIAAHATESVDCAVILEATERQIMEARFKQAPPEEIVKLATGQLSLAVSFLNSRQTRFVERTAQGLEILPGSDSALNRMAQTLDRHFGWKLCYDPLTSLGGAIAYRDQKRLLVNACNLIRPKFKDAIIEHEIEHIREIEVEPTIEALGTTDLSSPYLFYPQAHSRVQAIEETSAYRRTIYRYLKYLGNDFRQSNLQHARLTIETLKNFTKLALMTTGRNVYYLGRIQIAKEQPPLQIEFIADTQIRASLIDEGTVRIRFNLRSVDSIESAAVRSEVNSLVKRYLRQSEIMLTLFLYLQQKLEQMQPERDLSASESLRQELLRHFWRAVRESRQHNPNYFEQRTSS